MLIFTRLLMLFIRLIGIRCRYLFCFNAVRGHPVLGERALADAGISYSDIEQACVGYVYGKTSADVQNIPVITSVLSVCDVLR